jgi:YesN/AraC family two-component response regulator
MKEETDQIDEGIKALVSYIEKSRCYLDPDFSLAQLTDVLHTNHHYVSCAISRLATNFNALLNSYRIKHAIKELENKPDYKLNELAIESGFNNRRTFYNAFKAETGKSPSEYKAQLKAKLKHK